MTHMHLDHTSAISEFPKSTFIVSEAEWEDGDARLPARAERLPPHPLRLRLRLPDGRLRPRRRSTPTRPSAAPSTSSATARSGSPSPPATAPGHMSVIARLSDRDFVIGGDAMYTYRQLEADAPLPPRPFDAHNFRRSLQELRLFRREFPDAVITPGHDPASTSSSSPATSRPQPSGEACPGSGAPTPRAGCGSRCGAPAASSRAYIARTRPKTSPATSSWRSRLGRGSTG